MVRPRTGFEIRGTLECGWNIFHRKGYSTDPGDISVNHAYLDHLAEAGLNWLVVFWTNGEGFRKAWEEAAEYAHAKGLKIARAIYGFSGGGPEHTMAEPDAPGHLLVPSSWGPDTALCPHDEATRAWMTEILADRLEPGLDGIDIEPAREIGRNCICERCGALSPYEWDVMVVNFLTERIHAIRPDAEVMLHIKMDPDREGKRRMAEAFEDIAGDVRHIFAWGGDEEASLVDWLDAALRFEHFAKLGRALLFPEGRPENAVEDRVTRTFSWCRMAAERGKTGYLFDYRIFGGKERQGHEGVVPYTRQGGRLPASVALMGAAMQDPYLDEAGQRELIAQLRAETDWDLEDEGRYYGEA